MGSQGRGCMIRCRVSQMISHRGDFRASVLVASVLGFERMRSCEKCVLTAAERYEEQRAAGVAMGAPLCEGRGKAMQELENGRFAMIGAIGCACACQIPGSVPLLSFN